MPDAGRLLLAVDGGQSSTLTALYNAAGEILGSGLSGPCNHIHEEGGLERQYASLHEGMLTAFADAGLPPTRLACAFLGLTGSGHRETIERVYDTARLVIANDAVTALAGAIPDRVGCIIIGGTGAAAYGRNADGDTHLAGGMGFLLGDEGSAYDIAMQGFRAVYQAADGRGDATVLSQRVLDFYECETLKQLHRKVYAGEITRADYAKFAGLVGQAAIDGDAMALNILQYAAVELGKTVAAVLVRLGLTEGRVPVAPIGGVFNAGSLVTDPMMARVQEDSPQAVLVTQAFPPVVGAALLGLRAIGIEPDETILTNLRGSMGRLPGKR